MPPLAFGVISGISAVPLGILAEAPLWFAIALHPIVGSVATVGAALVTYKRRHQIIRRERARREACHQVPCLSMARPQPAP